MRALRVLLREESVSFQVIKTFTASNDPDYEAKQAGSLELYDIADGKAPPGPGDPTVVFCMDEFGPLNLQPHPGKQWARRPPAKATQQHPAGVAVGRPTPVPTASGTCSPPSTRDRLYAADNQALRELVKRANVA